MVQSSSWDSISKQVSSKWDIPSKKSDFEATQKRVNERKEREQMVKEAERKKESSSYGAWGSTFKNKDHFTSLHHC
ncbi:hypothetical protein NQ314_005922 [Rhamnusium bicolor]|uniref:Remorin C-terminal domain-containing protein n=1 Tax=Rhamnusium bicolor TaxID=1586634 RepID=A0AAV8ZDG8_9CUCU|nr:hypothetical protein NQ314_005922 [Rhamnusium bicolor]